MRGARPTRGAVVGLVLGAVTCLAVCAGNHPRLVGGPWATAADALSVVVVLVAVGWATGRSARAAHRVGAEPEPDGSAVSAAVRQVLAGDGLRTAFQPIVSLADGRVLGFEALSRFPGAGPGRSVEDWFTGAARVGLGVDLEVHAVRHALAAARALPPDAYVSVNLSPQALLWPGLPGALRTAPVPLRRIVVELTEHAAVDDYEALDRVLGPLREAGLRLAVDDVGAGYASFRHVLRLAPDLIKLDRSLISGIDGDPARRALAGAVLAFAREVRVVVVAEGIERSAELALVLDLGVDAGQGYLLGRPSTEERDWRSRVPGRPSRTPAPGVLSARS